jgi:hypothetical protein
MFSLYKQRLFLLWVLLLEASGPVLCLPSQASYCCEDPIFFLNQVGQYLDCFVHFIFSTSYSSVVHQKASNAAKPGRFFFKYSRPDGEAVIWLHEISSPSLVSVVLNRGFGVTGLVLPGAPVSLYFFRVS